MEYDVYEAVSKPDEKRYFKLVRMTNGVLDLKVFDNNKEYIGTILGIDTNGELLLYSKATRECGVKVDAGNRMVYNLR